MSCDIHTTRKIYKTPCFVRPLQTPVKHKQMFLGNLLIKTSSLHYVAYNSLILLFWSYNLIGTFKWGPVFHGRHFLHVTVGKAQINNKMYVCNVCFSCYVKSNVCCEKGIMI